MAKNLKNAVEDYYYDCHSTEEDLMGETTIHRKLVTYLTLVLQWLFHEQVCAIHENLNFYQTPDLNEKPVAPDIAIIKGVEDQDATGWKVGETGPAPHVVFEIASKETWKNDVGVKPFKYALMGVEEYFYYDPNPKPKRGYARRRLIGWEFNTAAGQITEIPLDQHGRLWSPHLNSFLVPDGTYLRLYDKRNQQRLTEAQAEAEAKQAETRRADAEASRADAEASRADALAKKLRSLGIDPNQIM